jgi:hypothetical protein
MMMMMMMMGDDLRGLSAIRIPFTPSSASFGVLVQLER